MCPNVEVVKLEHGYLSLGIPFFTEMDTCHGTSQISENWLFCSPGKKVGAMQGGVGKTGLERSELAASLLSLIRSVRRWPGGRQNSQLMGGAQSVANPLLEAQDFVGFSCGLG